MQYFRKEFSIFFLFDEANTEVKHITDPIDLIGGNI